MSKGLGATKRLKWGYAITREERICLCDCIEKELKRLEEIDNGADVLVQINRYNELCDKEIALEIIKNKEINIHALLLHLKRFDSPIGYNALVGEKYKLAQEEYDLLKEVLV